MAADNWEDESFAYEDRNSDDLQALRLTSLMIGLSNSKKPLSTAELRDLYYADMSEDAFAKKFQRDRKSLATCGIVVREVDRTGEGALWALDADATFATDASLSIETRPSSTSSVCPGKRPLVPYATSSPSRSQGKPRLHHGRRNPLTTQARQTRLTCAWPSLLERSRTAIPAATYQAKSAGEKNYTLALLGSFGMRDNTYFVACDYDRRSRQLSGSRAPSTRPLWQGQAACLANLPDTCTDFSSESDYVRAALPARPHHLHGKLPRTAAPAAPASRRRRRAIASYGGFLQRQAHLERGRVQSGCGRMVSTSGSKSDRLPSLQTATRPGSLPRRPCGQRAWRKLPQRPIRGREGQGAAAKGGLLEPSASALVGAPTARVRPSARTLSGAPPRHSQDHAKHLLSMLVDASDDKSLYRLPLLPADDMSKTVLMFRTLAGKPLHSPGRSRQLYPPWDMRASHQTTPFSPSSRGDSSQGPCKTTCQTTPLPSRTQMPQAAVLRTCSQAITRTALAFIHFPPHCLASTRAGWLPRWVDHNNGSWYLDAFDLARDSGDVQAQRISGHRSRGSTVTNRQSLRQGADATRRSVVRTSRPSLADAFPGTGPASTPLPSGRACPHLLCWQLVSRRLAACGNADHLRCRPLRGSHGYTHKPASRVTCAISLTFTAPVLALEHRARWLTGRGPGTADHSASSRASRSASTRMPLSDAVLISLPAACFTSMTASRASSATTRAARACRARARADRAELANGSLGITTQRSVSPVASNPSQNDLSASRDELLSRRKLSLITPGRTPLLADKRKPGRVQPRLQDLVHALHVPAVREQREHGAVHRGVHVVQQVSQALDVPGNQLGARHVLRHDHGHVLS